MQQYSLYFLNKSKQVLKDFLVFDFFSGMLQSIDLSDGNLILKKNYVAIKLQSIFSKHFNKILI